MSIAMSSQTYVPEGADGQLAEVRSFLEAHAERRGSVPPQRYLLVGGGEGEQIELPSAVYRVLMQVVEAMAAGKAVTVTPQEPQLTTQQAADLLGVSRPTVVRLIESGELRADRNGSRRRLLLSEVLAYRDRRRQRQYAMLEATAIDLDNEDDPVEVIERLRAARKAVPSSRLGDRRTCSPHSSIPRCCGRASSVTSCSAWPWRASIGPSGPRLFSTN